MPLYKFGPSDILYNTIKAYPHCDFVIFNSNVYYHSQSQITGEFTSSVPHVPVGHVSLYELNVDRDQDAHTFDPDIDSDGDGINEGAGVKSLIFPFLTKEGSLTSFGTVTAKSFNSDFAYGSVITSSYPLSSSIIRKRYSSGESRKHVDALQNTLNFYSSTSGHYAYSSSFGNKASSELNLISIPSIFFGSGIKKGTVSLKYFITGTLVGELRDINENGELIQTAPVGSTGSGSVAGVVLYNEGFVVLTGSWNLNDNSAGGYGGFDYLNDSTNLQTSSWLYYGVGMHDGIPADTRTVSYARVSASYAMDFKGTNHVPTLTMFANADMAELNHSNNPTFIEHGSNFTPKTGSTSYIEPKTNLIKNTMSHSYADPTASFQRQTFISKIGIYDENQNLIAIAHLATPVKKTEELDYTFKLKLDF